MVPLLADQGDSWALQINSVPANYSLNGTQILNEYKNCLKLYICHL